MIFLGSDGGAIEDINSYGAVIALDKKIWISFSWGANGPCTSDDVIFLKYFSKSDSIIFLVQDHTYNIFITILCTSTNLSCAIQDKYVQYTYVKYVGLFSNRHIGRQV